MPSQSMLADIRNNVLKGVGLGLFIATGFSLWVTILVLASGRKSLDSEGPSYGAVVGLYYIGGLAGGLLVGLAWPLKRFLFGSALLGMIGVFPLYLGAALLLSPESQWLTQDNILDAGLLSLLVGFPVGMASWLKANPPPPWINALLYPTRATVAVAWVVAALVSGGSLSLTKWSGAWPFALVVLAALALFAAPLGLALFVTLRRFGSADS